VKFLLQFNNANDTALAMIKLATNRDGNFINPNLCVSRRPSMVNYDEEYVEVISISKGHGVASICLATESLQIARQLWMRETSMKF